MTVSSVRSIIDYLESHQLLDARQKSMLLQDINLDESSLLSSDHRVLVSDYHYVWSVARKLSGDSAIGLRVGSELNHKNISLVASLVLYGECFLDGLAKYVEYAQILHNGMKVNLIVQGEEAMLRFNMDASDDYCRHDAERTMALCVNRFHHYCATRFVVNRVYFEHAAPGYLKDYRSVFNCELVFNAPYMAVSFPARFLNQRSIYRNPYIFSSLIEKANKLKQRVYATKIAEKVEGILSTELELSAIGAKVDIRLVSEKLNMTRQTLYRKLKQEGVAFSDILDKIRLSKAIEALHDRSKSLCDIALSLGFSDSSAFSRAFKRWTGRSPLHYRNEILST